MTLLSPELAAALALFAFVSSITPGPNNAMLMASGANFGLKRTLPHFAGVVIGFAILLLCIGFGLGAVFAAVPALHGVLGVAGAIYLLYLAWKIAHSRGIGGAAPARPQTFLQAVAFQWVNPKAWAMGLGALTTYVPQDRYVAGVLAMTLIFSLVNLPCVLAWAGLGVAMRRFLDRPGVLEAFNWAMAALLVASLIPFALEMLG